MDCDSSRPPSLFSCQVKLFHDWFSGWSDDQKNYLVMRLKDLDSQFFAKYEDYVANPHRNEVKDYFEPGFPEQDKKVLPPKTNGKSSSPTTTTTAEADTKKKIEDEEEEEDLKKNLKSEQQNGSSGDGLTTIKEDH